jgi:hypothetical protein
MWDEATGYNFIGSVRVDKTATGAYQRGKTFGVVESTVLWEGSIPSTQPIPAATVTSTPPVGLISNPQISNDAETVNLLFDYVGGKYNAFQLFVDTDQNPNTGFAINGIGAEALFENNTWNIYDGSGSDWKWQPTEVLIFFEDTGSRINWNISRTLLNSSQFDVVFQLVDSNWDTVFVTQKTSFMLK